MMRTACLVCFISFVNGHSKKKKPWKVGASSRHTTNLKQSIFAFRYLWCWATVVVVLFLPFVVVAAAALAEVAAVAAIAVVAAVGAVAAVATVATMAAVAPVAAMAAAPSTYLSTTVNYACKI